MGWNGQLAVHHSLPVVKSQTGQYVWDAFSLKGVKFNPLSANPTKWSNTLTQFVGNLPTNCLSVFDNFVGLALKVLIERSS